MTNGYNFYFKDGAEVLTFPITPEQLSIKVGSNNKTITLINEGDINLLKSPSLIEVEFEARFPMRQYPYAREFLSFETYFDKFTDLKNKKSFRFIVTRTKPNGDRTWDTNLLVALEDLNLVEDADEGDDVLIKFKLKQYKEYGVKRLNGGGSDSDSSEIVDEVKEETPTSTSTSTTARPNENSPSSKDKTHTVKSGETLWEIAKRYYGVSSNWKMIYNANKTAIEEDAKRHGKASSSNGKLLWAGITLIIPAG